MSNEKCLVSDCTNRKGEGEFIHDLCYPCHEALKDTPRSVLWQKVVVTERWVARKVAEIEDVNTDEAAHAMEDALYREIVRAVAQGKLRGSDAMRCAEKALTTQDIEFARWCA